MTGPAPIAAAAVNVINWSGLWGIVKASLTGVVSELEEIAEEDLAQVRTEIGGKFWAYYNANPDEVLAQVNILFIHIKFELHEVEGLFTALFGPNPNPPAAPAPTPTPPTKTSLPTGSTQND